jgi:hypothetical protein
MIPIVSGFARRATAADLLATYGEDARVEVVHGELLPKAPSHEKRDLVDKWRVLHAAGVPHYWVAYPAPSRSRRSISARTCCSATRTTTTDRGVRALANASASRGWGSGAP